MKRFVAAIGIILALFVILGGIRDFDAARNGLELFKGLFWLLAGSVALYGFIDDFRENKWPFVG